MNTPARSRLVELDALRGLALIGVCVLNYHGYLVQEGGSWPPGNFAERVFDPWNGPLSTRFAAVFVTLAGMGVSLLAARAVAAADRQAISDVRWTLVRRGVLLYTCGYFLNWVWSGTILFFYGAYFLAAAVLFTLRWRWLIAIGAGAALAAAAVRWWALDRPSDGHAVTWLLQPPSPDPHSPRELLLDTFVRGTHPLLPWLVFLCMGMVLGRLLPLSRLWRTRLAVTGAVCLALGYVAGTWLPWHLVLRSTRPFDRGVCFVIAAVGSTLLAVAGLGLLFRRTANRAATRLLADAGRTTLTIYVGHILVFNLLVHRLGWVHPAGLGTSLVFAVVYWVVAVAAAHELQRRHATGPLEWAYRRFS